MVRVLARLPDSIGGEVIAGVRRVNPELLWFVLRPQCRGRRTEDVSKLPEPGTVSQASLRATRSERRRQHPARPGGTGPATPD
jgi:hypothetical protein